jgi:hypothetical protein
VRNLYIRIGDGGVWERFSAMSSKESGKLKMAGGYLSGHVSGSRDLVSSSVERIKTVGSDAASKIRNLFRFIM